METVQQNGRFTPYSIKFLSIYSILYGNIFKTSLYIHIFQDEKCRLMRNLSLSMNLTYSLHSPVKFPFL